MSSTELFASAPVSAVILGVENLAASLAFYNGTLGLDIMEEATCSGPIFEAYWHLPAGTAARCAFLGHGADAVGRIQLMEFDSVERSRIKPADLKRAIGLFNLNIYTSDLNRDLAQLSEQGFSFWGELAHQKFGPAVGETYELGFDGPDGVAINLVELLTQDPATMIGHLYNYVAEYGRTETGFTSVVTTAHTVADMDKALEFYYGPLGMTLFVESVLEVPELNRAMGLPDDARTRSVLVQGGHEYGKVALAQPLNYEIPDLVPRAVAPNIGYLAQSFAVADLDTTLSHCATVNADLYAGAAELELPGRGKCRAAIVRNPGSGALQELYQRL